MFLRHARIPIPPAGQTKSPGTLRCNPGFWRVRTKFAVSCLLQSGLRARAHDRTRTRSTPARCLSALSLVAISCKAFRSSSFHFCRSYANAVVHAALTPKTKKLDSIVNETDPPLRPGLRWRHQLADGAHDRGDGFIMMGDAALELVELFRQLGIGRDHGPQAYEGAHDRDIHGDRTGGCAIPKTAWPRLARRTHRAAYGVHPIPRYAANLRSQFVISRFQAPVA